MSCVKKVYTNAFLPVSDRSGRVQQFELDFGTEETYEEEMGRYAEARRLANDTGRYARVRQIARRIVEKYR